MSALGEEIRELYLGDAVPWVIGYSGGKDSSAVLQLVWTAIRDLPPEMRRKSIHVITTDTLVEQPLVAAWVDRSQVKMREAAITQGLPITPHRLTPEIEDSFWVNLIGTREGWARRLSDQGFVLKGHRLVRSNGKRNVQVEPCASRLGMPIERPTGNEVEPEAG